MTVRVGFYHLVRWPLEQALPKLLEKALAARHRVVVMAGSAERVAFLDSLLWTWDPASWLPHGAAGDGDAALQPILLTDRDENANKADLLVLTEGLSSRQLDGFARCLVLFDGNDPVALETARGQWKAWKADGLELIYYQQTDSGGWQEKARANSESSTR